MHQELIGKLRRKHTAASYELDCENFTQFNKLTITVSIRILAACIAIAILVRHMMTIAVVHVVIMG